MNRQSFYRSLHRALFPNRWISRFRAEAFREQADQARARGEFDLAVKGYRRAIGLAPDLSRAWVHGGDLARDAHRWRLAAAFYRGALRIDKRNGFLWVQYGHCLKEARRFASAERAYRRAIALQPGVADPLASLGDCLRRKGDFCAAEAAYLDALQLEPNNYRYQKDLFHIRHVMGQVKADEAFMAVVIGTTGVCNASCVHCPTNKALENLSPQKSMDMDLFRQILEQVKASNRPIQNFISFGLFGDGLLDPHVIARAQLTRQMFPDVYLSLNTNAAAYNRERHRALRDYISILALHVESVEEETYNYLMQPLRFERTRPKIEMILEDFRGIVDVSVPLSRRNIDEFPNIKDFFLSRGARSVNADALSSRCASDRRVFDELSLGSHPGQCDTRILNDLIIDCDGKVLLCCNDFRRQEPLGDLSLQSLDDVLKGESRRTCAEKLAGGEWNALLTCTNCLFSHVPAL